MMFTQLNLPGFFVFTDAKVKKLQTLRSWLRFFPIFVV